MESTKVQEITGELQASLNGVGNASGRIGAALNHAQQVQAKMVALGVHGVAQGMSQVISLLESTHGQLNSHADQVKAAVVPISGVTNDMTIADVKAKLAAAIQSMTAARGIATGAIAEMGQAAQRVNVVLRGASPGELTSMIEAARQITLQSLGHLDAAKAKTAEADVAAHQAGN